MKDRNWMMPNTRIADEDADLRGIGHVILATENAPAWWHVEAPDDMGLCDHCGVAFARSGYYERGSLFCSDACRKDVAAGAWWVRPPKFG